MSVAGAYTDLPPANLTGPCLITYCVGSTVNPPNKNCQLSINTCTAQSRNFTDFFADPTNSSSTKNVERCSYNFVIQIAAEYGYCNIQELNGTVGGSGQTWSLFDPVSTLQLQYRGDVSTSPILSVESSTLSDFQHFFTGGAAAAATTTGAGGGSVTIPTTTGTAISTPFQTTTETAAATVTRTTSNLASGSPTTCSSDYMCGSLLVGMSITSGSLVATSTTTTTGKATGTKNGSKGISSDGRSLSANVLLGLGAFTILCTIITW